MRNLLKIIIALYIVFSDSVLQSINTVELILLLSLLSVTFFLDSRPTLARVAVVVCECVILVLVGLHTNYLPFALMIVLLDIIYSQMYYFAIVPAVCFLYFKCYNEPTSVLLCMILVGLIGYILKTSQKSKDKYIKTLDEERRVKYELELTKANLLKSNNELQALTQVKERNRIARDLHDNIGHKIAGVLISLQAVDKVYDTDVKNGKNMLNDCINHLQSTLQTIRDTVHNMHSEGNYTVSQLTSIAQSFKYCETSFETTGDVDNCPQKIIVTFSYVLKEALTNASKHSSADKIAVVFTDEDNLATLTIADNGTGCEDIVEGLGIRSMKERIKSIGGTIIIDGENGMSISCIVPH